MKFKLKLQDHKVGTLKHIVAVQENDEGKILNETNVGYIEGRYANQIEFKEMSD